MALAVMALMPMIAMMLIAAAAVNDHAGFLCKECLDVANDAQDFLTSPHNLDTAIEYVKSHGCAKVPAAYKDKCNEMSEEYVSVLFSTLQDYLTPQKLCLDSGICNGGGAEGRESSATSCSACLFVATKAFGAVEGVHARLRTACSSHKWIQDKCISMLSQIGPELLKAPAHICMESGICKANGSARRNNCALCRYLALEMKTKLQDPKTQEKLIEFLLENCQKLHNHEDECKLLVLEYGPQMLANLEAILDEDDICAKIGMCPSAMRLSSAI